MDLAMSLSSSLSSHTKIPEIRTHALSQYENSSRPSHLIDQSKVNLLLLFNLALHRTGLLPLPRTCKEGLRLE